MTEREIIAQNQAITDTQHAIVVALSEIQTKISNGNGSSSNNWTWQRCLYEAARTFGVPSVAFGAMILLAFQLGPQAIRNQTKFVEATIETQKKLTDTQEKTTVAVESIQQTAEKIAETSEATKEFMEQVPKEHTLLLEGHKAIIENANQIIKNQTMIMEQTRPHP